ncbi:MAG: ADP-ribosylglycohydrolase family protein [Alistipes sp.]
MIGAIIGDIVGSRWEFDPINNYNFELFSAQNDFTDDTICTIAVADAILKGEDYGVSIHKWCRRYSDPMGGYGGNFHRWVMSDYPQPYGSFGNGSAMRVSPVAWAFANEGTSEILAEAKRTAECTHNHPEGIKGAQAVALAIAHCRELHNKYERIGRAEVAEGLKQTVEMFEYDINIRRESVANKFDEICQGTVPVAFWIIHNSHSFEDAIRKTVSLGADADTLGAIVGSIAEAIWEIPKSMKRRALSYLPDDMKRVLTEFDVEYLTLSAQ